jgi:3-phenylpropionate/trans-cinnamate dioxygenase ferredoxin reductase component
MKKVRFLLIGGGIAAVSAARQLATCEPGASISIVNNESHPPYDRPPLSKGFLAGSVTFDGLKFSELDRLPNLTIRNDQVIGLDPSAHAAKLRGEGPIAFEKCLIATGGRARRPDVLVRRLQGVYLLRTAADVEALKAESHPGRRCVIVGAGFIGLELAATLTQMGLSVCVVEGRSSVWPQFGDSDVSAVLRGLCEARGVVFHLDSFVHELRGSTRVSSVLLRSGIELPCDLVVLCVGIEPNVELAREAGITVENGVVVDDRFQTSADDVYAAGDVCNFMDAFAGIRRRIEHWGHAEHSGQVAGRNMAGVPTSYTLLNYVWSDIFDRRIDYAGYHSNCEERVTRGMLGENGSCIVYLRRRKLVAYCAFNAPQRHLAVYNRLIRSSASVSPDQLSDTTTEPARLIRNPKMDVVAEG